MTNLVKVENRTVLTDTQIIAKQLGMKHQEVMRMVERFLTDYPDLREVSNHPKTPEYIRTEQRSYRGRDFTAAVMNRECFSLLFMRFETPTARLMQRKFNTAFYAMENALLREQSNSNDQMWLASRQQSKMVRLGETDVIKQFVEYAIAQGSESAKFYYKHVTMATYKCLQLVQEKKPALRDTLDALQLANLMACEGVAQRSILKHMAAGEHYKVVFELVKQDIERFANGLMLPKLELK